MTRSCWTCKWLHVPINKDGQRIELEGRGYECAWPLPERQKVCAALLWDNPWPQPVGRKFMKPNDGLKCPVWEQMP